MNHQEIKDKLDHLEIVRSKLKEKFIGIDIVIDAFINNVKLWYAVPELQVRPLIINLWGMTGVGKTDLIRNFVRLISYNHKFVEIQMDQINNGSYYSGIQYHLGSILDNPDESGILLLDEIQRFRTVNANGEDLDMSKTSKFSDIWTLLSDGKFSSDSSNRNALLDLMYSMMWDQDYSENNNSEDAVSDEPVKKQKDPAKRRFKTSYWRANQLKKLLKVNETIDEIMTWNEDFIFQKILDALKDNSTFEGDAYSKLLIIISGNIDEAYHMADETDSVDIDADIYHEYSKKITMLDIKNALLKRFKPEQIARFGNIHLIYPSLNKESYNKIINLKCKDILDNIESQFNVRIDLTQNVINMIYRNGVFPTQGVRPVLSTISSVIESSVPFFLYNCMIKNKNYINIDYANKKLVAHIEGEELTYDVTTTIDDLKSNKTIDKEARVAIHEIGHAICYMQLFKTVPVQLVSNAASSDINGFVMTHMMEKSKSMMLKHIIVSYGGQCAEEIIFGLDKRGGGNSADLKTATKVASDYVRALGMDGYVGNIIVAENNNDLNYGIIESGKTSDIIESLLKSGKEQCIDILNNNLMLMKKLAECLLENKIIKQETIFDISKDYISGLEIIDMSYVLTEDYYDIMKKKFADIK